MPNLTTYFVEGMRVILPSDKVRERNPERVFTIVGKFHEVTTNDDGSTTTGDPLSIPSKNVDKSDALAEGFALDPVAQTLTIPSGQKGRQKAPGLSADAIAKALAALKPAASK